MPRPTNAERLANYERRYRELAAQLADIGLIASGSVIRRHSKCGTPTCRCHADPPQLHGPYWQWSAKRDGKTVTRNLTDQEAALYKEWIANDRELRRITTQMRNTAEKATTLMLKQAKLTRPRV